MIDPATSWFEIVEIPTVEILNKNGEKEVIFEKTSARISRLINKTWFCQYPRPKYIIYDNGSEFKAYFEELCDTYHVQRKPTTIKNPQANSILERIHAVIGNMLRTRELDGTDIQETDPIKQFITDAAWAIRSTHHTVLGSTPAAAIFGRDMLFDIPYLADWNKIGQRRQILVDKANERENKKRVDFDYAIGNKILIAKDGVLRKAESKYEGPNEIIQVYKNDAVRIKNNKMTKRLNIRRIIPHFEDSTV